MILLLSKSYEGMASFRLHITHIKTGFIQYIQRTPILKYAFLLINKLHKQSSISQITFRTSTLSIYKFIRIEPFIYTIFIIPHQPSQILEDIFFSLKKPCQQKERESMLFQAILTSIILFGGAFIFQRQSATQKTSYQ